MQAVKFARVRTWRRFGFPRPEKAGGGAGFNFSGAVCTAVAMGEATAVAAGCMRIKLPETSSFELLPE